MAQVAMPFLEARDGFCENRPFECVFIRAPIVEKILPIVAGRQEGEFARQDTVVAPARSPEDAAAEEQMLQPVEVMAKVLGRSANLEPKHDTKSFGEDLGDIVAVTQGNVFGTSFHPELTDDARIHIWWLKQVRDSLQLD